MTYLTHFNKIRETSHKILRWSEKYTRTDMVYLSKGSFWLTLGQIIPNAASLILAIIFAHFVSKNTYGYYKYILSLGGLISAFSLSGIGPAIVRAVANKKEGAVRFGFILNLKWGILTLAVGLTISLYYFFNKNSTLGVALLVIAICQPIINSGAVFPSFLNGKSLYRYMFIVQTIKNITPSIFVFLAIIFSGKILTLIFAYFLSNALAALATHFVGLQFFNLNKNQDVESLSYAKHLSLTNFIGTMGSNIDSLMIFHFLGSVPLASYAFAVAIPDKIIGLFKNIYTLSLPKFSTKTPPELKQTIKHKFYFLFFVSLAIYALYFVLAPTIFQFLFPQYLDATFYSRIFAINIIFAALGMIPAAYFDSKTAKRKKYAITTFSTITKTGLMLLLIGNYGIMGIILAELISFSLSIVLMAYLIFKK